MKTKLILLTVSAAVLAASADCHAMLRRAPVKMAAPRAQRAPQRLFSFVKNHENKLAMPMVAGNRLNAEMLKAFSKHQELSKKRADIAAEIKNNKKAGVYFSAFMAPMTLAALAMSVHNLGAIPMATLSVVPVWAHFKDMQVDVQKQKSIEQELADLVAEQKRNLANPEDKQ